jgi:hypothetical protein
VNRLRPGLHVPFDVNAQKDDPIVSFSHSLRAFAALAPGFLSERDTAGLARGKPGPDLPYVRTDPLTSRRIYLRRETDDVRVTIREGTHEMLSAAAFAWFDQFQRRCIRSCCTRDLASAPVTDTGGSRHHSRRQHARPFRADGSDRSPPAIGVPEQQHASRQHDLLARCRLDRTTLGLDAGVFREQALRHSARRAGVSGHSVRGGLGLLHDPIVRDPGEARAVERSLDLQIEFIQDQRTIDGDRERLLAFVEFPLVRALTAVPEPNASMVQQVSTGRAYQDPVQAQLCTEELTRGTRIDVSAQNGVVTLRGTVTTQSAKQRAVELARGVEGVANCLPISWRCVRPRP